MASDYKTGTVSIVNGERALTGAGTAWLLADFREGDTLFLKGYAIPIESVDSDTEITLSDDWPGATVSASAYRMRFETDVSRMAAKVQTLIDGLADNKGDKGDPGANFDPDAAGLFAERSAYDAEAEGFSFLSGDGDGGAITTSVIFIRQGAAGEWSAPIPFQGFAGADGEDGDDGADAALEVARDSTPVVASPAAAIDFSTLFSVAPAEGDAGRALVSLDETAMIAFIDTALGGDFWRTGGSAPLLFTFEDGGTYEFEDGTSFEFEDA